MAEENKELKPTNDAGTDGAAVAGRAARNAESQVREGVEENPAAPVGAHGDQAKGK